MKIDYTLRRSKKRRKTISLTIGEAGNIIIHAPHFTPVGEINRFVYQKQNWIEKTIKKQIRTRLLYRKKEFVSGETFPYLGEGYPLEVFFEPQQEPGVSLQNGRFYLNAPADIEIKKNLFIAWYKQQAADYIGRRVDFFCRQFHLKTKGLRISAARQRWGSCSPENKLAFSFRLMMMPPDIVDYVIVHELMHIRQKNHSRRFWKLVEAAMPLYQLHRRRLRELGEGCTF